MPRTHDIFISYKSENVTAVRAVVDCLIAGDIDVWFDEYRVLLHNYDNFQDEIDRGIDASRYAIVFTNNAWAESPYCGLEIERILERAEAARVLEVCIPSEEKPYEYWPSLKGVRSMRWRRNVREVTEFIGENTDLDLSSVVAPGPDDTELRSPEIRLPFGVSLRTGDYEESAPLFSHWFQRGRKFPGEACFFRGEIESGQARLPSRLMVTINPVKTVLDLPSVAEDGAVDDRKIKNAFRDVAKEWAEEEGFEARGVHLFFWGGSGTLALTYQEGDAEMWHRRYILLLKETSARGAGEIGVDFVVKLSETDRQRHLVEFCGLARQLDAIASSLSFSSGWLDAIPQRILYAAVSLSQCALMVTALFYMLNRPAVPWELNLAVGLCGAFAGTFLGVVLSSKVRWEILRIAIPIGRRPPFFALLGRSFERMVDLWVANAFWTLLAGLKGFAVLLAAVVVGIALGVRSPWFWGLAALLVVVSRIRGTKDNDAPPAPES